MWLSCTYCLICTTVHLLFSLYKKKSFLSAAATNTFFFWCHIIYFLEKCSHETVKPTETEEKKKSSLLQFFAVYFLSCFVDMHYLHKHFSRRFLLLFSCSNNCNCLENTGPQVFSTYWIQAMETVCSALFITLAHQHEDDMMIEVTDRSRRKFSSYLLINIHLTLCDKSNH